MTFGLAARFSIELVVQAKEALGGVAIKVEPPDASEDLLVEDGSIGAQECPALVSKTLMPSLAPKMMTVIKQLFARF